MIVIAGTVELLTALISFAPCLMMPSCSYFRPTMKPVMLCRNTSGTSLWLHSSMNCAPFCADSENKMPLFARMPIGKPCRCAAAHQRRSVERLELGEPRAIDDPRDHLARVVRHPD